MNRIAIIISFFFYSLLSFAASGQSKQTSVLVIGGTTSGFSAGLQSARLNVPTIIVEETPWLGGMMTAAGVSGIDGNHELYSGIWNEFRAKIRAHYGGESAVSTGWVSNTLFEPHVGDSIIKAMIAKENQLSVIYSFHLTGVLKDGNKVIGAEFENTKGEKLIVKAKVVIDATDLGDGLKMAGAGYDLGMESRYVTGEEAAPETANDIIQDLTWVAILKDYGTGTNKTIDKPATYNPDLFTGSCDHTVDMKSIDCKKMLSYGRLPNNKYMINWPIKGNDIYLNVVEMDWKDRNEILKLAKEHTLNFVYYIQTELGFRNIGLADNEFPTKDRLALVPYHREGRRLKGIVRFNLNNILDIYSGQPVYRTGVSVGNYPVDHHHKCRPDAPEIKFPQVPSFNIPLGALIPEKLDGLIVSDKAISVSNLLNGSTRLQPCVILTGQAAGVLAALSAKTNKEVREINIRKLQQVLLDAGAYLMPLVDVTPADKDFQAIQRVSASGILYVKGEPYKWANRTWFYPDTTITIGEFANGLHSFENAFPVKNDTSILTMGKAMEMISALCDKDVIPEAKSILEKKCIRKFSPELAITKRELSILTDLLINPFEVKEVDFNGNYK